MTIPFGRRRLILTFQVVPAPGSHRLGVTAAGLDDHDLARLARGNEIDLDRARWEGLTLIYGGQRRP